MNPDPLGTRSPSVFDALASIGVKRPMPNSVRQSLTSSGITFRPTLAGETPSAPKVKIPLGVAAPNPATAPVSAPAPVPAPTAAPPSFTFNPDEDPIVQMVKAAGQRSVQQAEGSELAGRKQTLIDYGYDPALSSLYPDQPTSDAAQQNPFSFLANLGHGYDVAGHNLDEQLNKQNLFYSGYRGTQLGELARSEGQQQAAGYGNLQHTLGALSDALLKARADAEGANLNAAGDAYGRYTPPETAPNATAGANAAAALGGGDTSSPTPAAPGVSPAVQALLDIGPALGSMPEASLVPMNTPTPFPIEDNTHYDYYQPNIVTEPTVAPPPMPPAAPVVTDNSSYDYMDQPQLDDQILAELARIRRQQ